MNQSNTGKKLIRLEVKELCNETKSPIDIQYNFPTLSDEYLEKAPPEEKMHLITNYLNQQKKSLTEYKRLEQRMLEKEHKKELFILKYNTFDGFPKHPKVFQKRIKEQEIFSKYPFQTEGFQNQKKQLTSSTSKKPWNYVTQYSNYFDAKSCYKTVKNNDLEDNRLKLGKLNAGKTENKLWENFTHPHDEFERRDVDEWDYKIKWRKRKTGTFVTSTRDGGFFDKTIKDYI